MGSKAAGGNRFVQEVGVSVLPCSVLNKMVYNTNMIFLFKSHDNTELDGSVPISGINGSPDLWPKATELDFLASLYGLSWIATLVTIKSLSPK